jgi:signal transduction histidine kinase
LTARRRWVLRAGFAALLILLGVSVFLAYRIQQSLSDKVAKTYYNYIQQEESLFNLRRSLWLSSIQVRDLLLDASADREAKFAAAAQQRKNEAADAIAGLGQYPIPGQNLHGLSAKLADFWETVAAVPASTRSLSQAERYGFVQNEVTARRVALSELVREISDLSRRSLADAERGIHANRESASRMLLVLLALALVTGLVFIVLSVRRLNLLESQAVRQYEEVSQTKAELRALSTQLMSIQEIERARLSRELHDEIGQALATLRLELARLESGVRDEVPDIYSRLSRARTIIDSTVKATRSISLMLRPSLLDDLGLVSALQWLTEDTARRTGLRCTVQEENTGVADLPIDVRTCVYRVAQEALHNVEKHARARHATISLWQRHQELELRVEDDGCGIEADSPGPWRAGAQLGILGMRERVAALNGRFTIGPAPDGGTRVDAWLPLAAGPGIPSAQQPAGAAVV